MPRGRPRYPDVLTPREWEVLDLLSEGLTNPQIAERLGISENGVKYHVLEILSKLGVSSRYEAAAWCRETAGSRRFAGLAALFTLRPPRISAPTASKMAMPAMAATVLGIIAVLAVGVLVMNQRTSGPAAPVSETSQSGSQTSRLMPTPTRTPTARLTAGIPIGPENQRELPATAIEVLSAFAANMGTAYAGVCAQSTQPGHLCLTAFDGAGDIQHTSILVQLQVFGLQMGYQVVLAPQSAGTYEISGVTGPDVSAIPAYLLD